MNVWTDAGLAAAIYLYATVEHPAETELIVPFFKDVVIPLGMAWQACLLFFLFFFFL